MLILYQYKEKKNRKKKGEVGHRFKIKKKIKTIIDHSIDLYVMYVSRNKTHQKVLKY